MTAYNSLSTYATITGGYWAFTLTDGAIRMLIVLYFHQLGYSPLAIASLFLFYEFFGIITNLLGGWLGSKIGLNRTMHLGMLLQVMALLMLTVPADYLTVAYVMLAQALSGIAKDLNKMSAKASVKLVIPSQTQQNNPLFKWVAMLTGSKNTLKGIGFFLGGFLLSQFGFQSSLYTLAGGLFLIFIITCLRLPQDLGKTKASLKFTQLFSQSSAINWLSAARFFLFGSRDVWFVVALPIYFSSELGWTHQQTGSFFAFWIIGYGIVQALTPSLLRQQHPTGTTATQLAFFLSCAIGYRIIFEWLGQSGSYFIVRPFHLRRDFCYQFCSPLLSHHRMVTTGYGCIECGILLHGECRRSLSWHSAIRPDFSELWP
jgi:hypothetical protein